MDVDGELGIVLVYPDLLGTYGDRGNALALAHRARARQIPTRIVEVPAGGHVPVLADIYLVGGGEDSAETLALRYLERDGGLPRALDDGATCLAVCAGFQMLSRRFSDTSGAPVTGLGLLDVECGRLPGPRAVGEVVAQAPAETGFGTLTGYENHQGGADLGPAARPLGRLVRGTGNGDGRTEGAMQGNVVATYLHGPVLVRNPALADHLLTQVVGDLPPFVDRAVERLRAERLEDATRDGHGLAHAAARTRAAARRRGHSRVG
ncbi:MAG: type 1 glutamine amidotransferase [Nocardioidaceae bacterium]